MFRRLLLCALVTATLCSAAPVSQAQILGIGGRHRDEAPLLPRVKAQEFAQRCNAPAEGVTEETAESYDLIDNLSGAPLAARNGVSVLGSAGTDAQLNAIMRLLVAQAPPPAGVDVHVDVQNSDDIDARQFGAGQILITRGLVTTLRGQQNVSGEQIADQFAFILAHEYSHVLLCHYTRSVQTSRTRSMLRSASAIGLMAISLSNTSVTRSGNSFNANTDATATQHDYLPVMAGLTVLRTMNSSVVNPAWGRAQERDADQLAVELMTAAGFHADNLGDMLPLLNQADNTFNQNYNSIVGALPQQAISASLTSLQQQGGQRSLTQNLTSMGLNTGIQMLAAWRSNQLRHFHDNPQKRTEMLADFVQRSAPVDASAASAYASMAPRSSIGAAILTSSASEMTAPELGLQAVRLLASNNLDGGCSAAARALAAGPNDITALSASGQCELGRHNIPNAARRFDAVLRSPQATTDDYLEVSTLWQEADQRPRAESALTAGGRRYGAPRFYVPRMNLLARYQDIPGVQAVGAECAGATAPPEVKQQCNETLTRITAPAATTTAASGQATPNANPLGGVTSMFNNVAGGLGNVIQH